MVLFAPFFIATKAKNNPNIFWSHFPQQNFITIGKIIVSFWPTCRSSVNFEIRSQLSIWLLAIANLKGQTAIKMNTLRLFTLNLFKKIRGRPISNKTLIKFSIKFSKLLSFFSFEPNLAIIYQ